jgi:3-oxoacyl-[acyl-carrier-protein] synthase-3
MDRINPEKKIYTVIIGSGSYLPSQIISNNDFINHSFYDENGHILSRATDEIIPKFSDITGILERRYVTADLVASDIAVFAAEDAIANANIDAETLDYIIVAHNFGDIKEDNRRSEFVPALASRVKHRLGIKNPDTVCYDLPFGCAGWLQGVIQADFYIHAKQAKRVLVIGAETLSRICDPHDRDSMLYADGAGALIVEARESDTPVGILAHSSRTYAEHAFILRMDRSNNPDYEPADQLFLKMQGRTLYEQALKIVPQVIKESLEKAGVQIESISKILIHQANKKMMEAILKRTYEEFCIKQIPENVMPITVSWLGNSSVATLPTLYDLISKDQLTGHQFTNGGIMIFASVGAGVNVNSVIYKIPG